MIDLDYAILIGNRTCRASLNAHLTADTTDLADLLDDLTGIPGRTRDKDAGALTVKFDNTLWTGFYAVTATDTGQRGQPRESHPPW